MIIGIYEGKEGNFLGYATFCLSTFTKGQGLKLWGWRRILAGLFYNSAYNPACNQISGRMADNCRKEHAEEHATCQIEGKTLNGEEVFFAGMKYAASQRKHFAIYRYKNGDFACWEDDLPTDGRVKDDNQ